MELPYAMMIVYAHLFKCLEPILIIVSTLMIGDPYAVQSSLNPRRILELKQRLTSKTNSDHFIFCELYQVSITRSIISLNSIRCFVAMGTFE